MSTKILIKNVGKYFKCLTVIIVLNATILWYYSNHYLNVVFGFGVFGIYTDSVPWPTVTCIFTRVFFRNVAECHHTYFWNGMFIRREQSDYFRLFAFGSFRACLVPNSTTWTPAATNTSYEHRRRTPPADELRTILQLVVQQIHHQRSKICHIPTSWHVEMLGSGIAMWQICCRIVVSSSVGGVRWWCCMTCP